MGIGGWASRKDRCPSLEVDTLVDSLRNRAKGPWWGVGGGVMLCCLCLL